MVLKETCIQETELHGLLEMKLSLGILDKIRDSQEFRPVTILGR
jgi:hypothetical protein